VWLLGWTFGGLAAASQVPKGSPGEAGFLLLWLCGWVVGECVVVCTIAWQLFGRGSLVVTPSDLEVRREIARFAWTRRYDAALVQDITAERVPHDEDEKRTDFCLRVSYDGEVVRVGEGMGEREAEYVASLALSRIRRRSWWSEEDKVRPNSALEPRQKRTAALTAGHFHLGEPARKSALLLAAGLIASITIIGALLVARFGGDAAPQRTARAPGSQQFFPSRQDFTNAREYAAAMTSYTLTSGRGALLERPNCGERVAWTHWTCRVRVKDTIGPFAGRALPYRCSAADTGWPSSGGVICGPAIPGRLTAPPDPTAPTDDAIP
jgi:hypothetical protein